MPILILARHGRTAANATGVLAGRTKGVHLDHRGIEQAREAGARLAGLPVAAAITSPLERCRETARELLSDHGLRARVERGLNECDYGEWTNQKLTALAKHAEWKTIQNQPSAAVFPGGESMAAMSARAVDAVRRHDRQVADEHGPNAVWLAVSHGDVIKAVLADALGMHLDSFQRIVVHPGSLSVVHYAGARTFVHSVNTRSGSLTELGEMTKSKRPRRHAVVGGDTGARP